MNYGSALDLIQTNFVYGLPEPVICGILRDVLQAVIYLHAKGYIHRNIRANHILVSCKGQAVLTGLDDAYCIVEKGRWQRAVYDYPSQPENSLCWLSPELLQQNLRGYNEKSDIYSLGITACEMANGVSPYTDLQSTELLISKLQGQPPQLWDSQTVPTQQERRSQPAKLAVAVENSAALPVVDSGVFDGVTATSNIQDRLEAAAQRTFSRAFHRFTMLTVQFEPTLRPSAGQLIKHAFIQSSYSSRKSTPISWEEYLSSVPTIDNSLVDADKDEDQEQDSRTTATTTQFEPAVSWDFS